MKRLRAFALPFMLVYAVSSSGQSRSNPEMQEMIEAGGPTFLDVTEIHSSGRFFSFSKGELNGSDLYSDYIKFPDMERTEFGRERKKTITINKGNQGWKISVKKEVEPQSAGEADEFVAGYKTSFDYVLRVAVKDSKSTVQTLSPELVDFKRADVIELRDSTKNLIRFYIDRSTHLPLKMQVRRAGSSVIREELYSNWHKFGGVMTALSVIRYTDGRKTMEIHAEMVAYNSGLADSLFAVPAGK